MLNSTQEITELDASTKLVRSAAQRTSALSPVGDRPAGPSFGGALPLSPLSASAYQVVEGSGFGIDASAAVRMHLTPAINGEWTICHLPKATLRFQRWKAAI